MSKIQRLNFGADFQDFVRGMSTKTSYHKWYDAFAVAISEAQTFLLPDGGIYSAGKHIPAEFAQSFRLPYPVTVFEYSNRYSDGSPSRRLVLAVEDISDDGKLESIRVMQATGLDGAWLLNPQMAFWKAGETFTVTAEAHEAGLKELELLRSESGNGAGGSIFEVGTKLLNFDSVKLFDNPGEFNTDKDNRYDTAVVGSVMYNVAYACLIMSCRNVKVVDVPLTPGDRYINEKRVRKGLTPFVEYKVLQLGDKNIYTNNRGGHHESPKWHMVMGFVRRLTDDKYYPVGTPDTERTRTTFVAAHARGNADKGKIIKDYQIGAPL